MNLRSKSSIIFTITMTLLVFILLVYPLEGSYLLYILRGLIFIGVLWILTLLIIPLFRDSKTKFPREKRDTPETIKKQMDVQLQGQYEELLDNMLMIIKSMNEDYISAVYIIDPASNGYILQNSSTDTFSDFVPLDNSIFRSLLKQEEAMVLQQKDVREGWNPIFSDKIWRGSECLIGTPILYQDTSIGCIILKIDHFSKIQERDQQILRNLGHIFSAGMYQIEKIEKQITDNYYKSRITGIIEAVDISSDEKEILNLVLGLCKTFFNYDKLSISMVDNAPGQAVIKLVDGLKEEQAEGDTFSIQSSVQGIPIRDGKSIRSINWEKDFDELSRFGSEMESDYNFMAILAVPIKTKNKIMGVIAVERLTSRLFTESDQMLLELLASTTGSILTWSEAYQKMHQSAIHDGLTGLLNHKAFMQRIEEEISRAIRFQQNLVLLVLDLDKFKRVNDTHGHLYGDYVIETVAKLIKNNVRNIDVVARYGGEEFTVVLVNTTGKDSFPIAKRIVRKISEYGFSLDNVNVHVTISGGMAEFPKDSDQVKGLIEKADTAMYASKDHSGNMVTIYNAA